MVNKLICPTHLHHPFVVVVVACFFLVVLWKVLEEAAMGRKFRQGQAACSAVCRQVRGRIEEQQPQPA